MGVVGGSEVGVRVARAIDEARVGGTFVEQGESFSHPKTILLSSLLKNLREYNTLMRSSMRDFITY